MVYYSWIFFFMYIWYFNTWSYTDKIGKIIDCGINNNIAGSKYATEEFKESVWSTVESKYGGIYATLRVWWHPAVWVLMSIAYAVGGAMFDIVFMAISIWYMLDFQDTVEELNEMILDY